MRAMPRVIEVREAGMKVSRRLGRAKSNPARASLPLAFATKRYRHIVAKAKKERRRMGVR
jgi:hypothetical protein